MTDQDRAEVVEQLRRVIAWEIEAQAGVERAIDQVPPLIADTLLDYFDVMLKPGLTFPSSREPSSRAAIRSVMPR